MKHFTFIFILFLSSSLYCQTDFDEIDFGAEMSEKSLYQFILDRPEFADLGLTANNHFRKVANVKKVKVLRYVILPRNGHRPEEVWEYRCTDVLSCDRDGIVTEWRRQDTVQTLQMMQLKTTKDSLIQIFDFDDHEVKCSYYKGLLVKKTARFIEEVPHSIDGDEWIRMIHLPLSFRYTNDHRLLKVQHCCHLHCSFELKYSYPQKNITLVTCINGEDQSSVVYDNKQVFDAYGNLLKSSFRKASKPEVQVRYLINYDRTGDLKDIIRQTEDAEAVRDEVWVQVQRSYNQSVVSRRDVVIKTKAGYYNLVYLYDNFGRISEFNNGYERFVYSYNAKASEE